MHIMEGFLPPAHAIAWYGASMPFIVAGAISIRRQLREYPQARLLLGASGAFAFVLSALKLPSVSGSCSHPTGVGLGAVLFGPTAMTVLGAIVLLFQALLLAHGGLTTLGANIFSMAIIGPFVSYSLFKAMRSCGGSISMAIFVAATLGDLATYIMTACQLALAFPDPLSGFTGSLVKFLGIFAITQIPLAITEGLVTVVVMNFLMTYSSSDLRELRVMPKESLI